MVTVNRRTLLLGAAGTMLLAACGSDGSGDDQAASSRAGDPILFAAFAAQAGYVASGVEQRLVFAIGSPAGGAETDLTKLPETLTFQPTRQGPPDAAGQRTREPVGDPITVERHADGVPTPYYPLRFTPDRPGVWGVTTTIDGAQADQAFQVTAADEVKLVQVGQNLPAVATATTADARGVDPMCTRLAGPCPFHDTSLDVALGAGRPIALLVATPEFCQTAICGPVLDLLMEQQGAFPAVQFLHVEVYKDARATGNIARAKTAEIVSALGMNYEPGLFLATPDGTVVERLDNAFDRRELREGLTLVSR